MSGCRAVSGWHSVRGRETRAQRRHSQEQNVEAATLDLVRINVTCTASGPRRHVGMARQDYALLLRLRGPSGDAQAPR
jgi:hypothetical protein